MTPAEAPAVEVAAEGPEGASPAGAAPLVIDARTLEWARGAWHADRLSVTGWRGWSLDAGRGDGDRELLVLRDLALRSPEGWSLSAVEARAHLPSGEVALWAAVGRLGPWDLAVDDALRGVDGTWRLRALLVVPCAGWARRDGLAGQDGGEPEFPARGSAADAGPGGGGRGEGATANTSPAPAGAEACTPAGPAGGGRPTHAALGLRARAAEVAPDGTLTLHGARAELYGVPVLPLPWWRLSTKPTRLHLLLPELGVGSPGWSAGWQAELVTPAARAQAGFAWREDRGLRFVGAVEPGVRSSAGFAADSPEPPVESTAVWSLGHDTLTDTTRGALRAEGEAALARGGTGGVGGGSAGGGGGGGSGGGSGGIGAAWQLDLVSDAAWDADMGAGWLDRGVDWHQSRVALFGGDRAEGRGLEALATSGSLGAGLSTLRVGAGWSPGREGLVLREGPWLGAVGGRLELGGLPGADERLQDAAAGGRLWGWVSGAGDTWDLDAGAELRAWTGARGDTADLRLALDGGVPAWTAGPRGGGVLRWRLGGRVLGEAGVELDELAADGATAGDGGLPGLGTMVVSGGPGLRVTGRRAGAEAEWWWGDALPGLLGAPAFTAAPALSDLANVDAAGSAVIRLPDGAGRPLGRAWAQAGALRGRVELGGGGLGAGVDAGLGPVDLGLDLAGTVRPDPLTLGRLEAAWRLGHLRLAGRADADLGALALTGGALGLGWDDGCLAAGLRAELSPDRALPDLSLQLGLRR